MTCISVPSRCLSPRHRSRRSSVATDATHARKEQRPCIARCGEEETVQTASSLNALSSTHHETKAKMKNKKLSCQP